MDALFHLEFSIPENIDKYDIKSFSSYQKKEIIICFLLASEAKIGEIKIFSENKIYFLGVIKKDKKALNIYYIEAIGKFRNNTIKIQLFKNSFFVNLDTNEINQKNIIFLIDSYQMKIIKKLIN